MFKFYSIYHRHKKKHLIKKSTSKLNMASLFLKLSSLMLIFIFRLSLFFICRVFVEVILSFEFVIKVEVIFNFFELCLNFKVILIFFGNICL